MLYPSDAIANKAVGYSELYFLLLKEIIQNSQKSVICKHSRTIYLDVEVSNEEIRFY